MSASRQRRRRRSRSRQRGTSPALPGRRGEAGIDAVFAASDLMAEGSLHVSRQSGSRVPDEVALGLRRHHQGCHTEPPLITVRQPMDGVGRHLAAHLLRLIAGEAVEPAITLTASSSASPPERRGSISGQFGRTDRARLITGAPGPPRSRAPMRSKSGRGRGGPAGTSIAGDQVTGSSPGSTAWSPAGSHHPCR
ncbi:hypothetical protein E1161_12700 [Saccharopolyspora aridisoli]|uniref:Transcriptional regulator LacI/GalR-like sensor domain-containing protein n=1 Tax=Saccharopolyspora aridisoli TaxID=2530385 RepID=A0A4R4UU37_9PSEU|nr:hypothetical protein E1161_12700 [Saccharopolyspora aridisoli]